MRGLPELLRMVDEIYDSPKVSSSSILLFKERPVDRVRPIFRNFKILDPTKAPAEQDFTVAFDVSSFKPEEISVKLVERDILVEGKHEEREDEHGFIARQLTRRITIPKDYDIDTVTTYLNNDGKMTVKALKPKPFEPKERIIPIKRVASEELEDMAAAKKKNELEANEKAKVEE